MFIYFVLDNLNGAQILGRTIRVDHVDKYKKKEEEDEETQQRKREERGVCRAFQRGECNRGAGCKFSHDEQVSKPILELCFPLLTMVNCYTCFNVHFIIMRLCVML